ncbi:hypothetical protein HEQ62_03480 [Haematospirillum jordaniae]|uniref:Nucleoside recognition protein n=1 Tax=Haematospirillum jordaniae TaxID=1549855 RepID=A0A143DD62_9PROT|nr:hypothetical protein [Haematospirillum jordaniae]AMW34657.1 hypothetical protein AY555_05090 [Haematospirillum jordaniae]NKD44812.1 hypothetical protein [Haematospirillum jordaniae]NKD57003.1 hypothetical protein [Haematospirillum jordaniae]NKD58841.1 hypothetical protein [Haematospirillum jordaniae]NKD66928.1 hypothetical protein [Haematospirillum jordaniae]
MSSPASFAKAIGHDTLRLYWSLLKIMVPVMVLVRIAVELDAVPLLAAAFEPLTGLVGLPPETGMVWATTCLVGIYGGVAVLLGLLPELSLSAADLTVLGGMMLAAHSFPIELRVARRAGVGIGLTVLLRMAFAVGQGALLQAFYGHLDILQEPGTVLLATEGASQTQTRLVWLIESLKSLAVILPVIAGLVLVLRIMDRTGITAWLTRIMGPLLRVMGMSRDAAPLTMVGVLLGLTYGGGLIIDRARSGALKARDVVISVCFMSLCHNLIEDSLLVLAMGGHWSGIIVARIIMAVGVIAVLARIIHAMPDSLFHRLVFCREPQDSEAKAASS